MSSRPQLRSKDTRRKNRCQSFRSLKESHPTISLRADMRNAESNAFRPPCLSKPEHEYLCTDEDRQGNDAAFWNRAKGDPQTECAIVHRACAPSILNRRLCETT